MDSGGAEEASLAALPDDWPDDRCLGAEPASKKSKQEPALDERASHAPEDPGSGNAIGWVIVCCEHQTRFYGSFFGFYGCVFWAPPREVP